MLTRIARRILWGICFALVAMLVVTVATTVEAQSDDREGPVRTDCNECHQSVVTHWEGSSHGLAYVDEIFQAAWEEQGSPGECLSCHTTGYDAETGQFSEEGIACQVCHSGQTGPHPEVLMPTDPSSRLCGSCHIDTFNEWEISEHGKNNMTCVNCHNPHTTDIRTADVQELCATCHNEEGHFYGYTAHAQQGLLCTDCHLQVDTETPMGDGHGMREHTFMVDLGACTQCHGQEMHFPSEDQIPPEEPVDFMWAPYASSSDNSARSCPGSDLVVNQNPPQAPLKPLNYLLVGAVGLAFGIAVSPWAEDRYRRLTNRQ